MKQTKKIAAVLLAMVMLLAPMGIHVFGEGEPPERTVGTVSAVSVEKLPDKTNYTYPEDVQISLTPLPNPIGFGFAPWFPRVVLKNDIDLDGMQLKISYSDGTDEIVTVNDGVYIGADAAEKDIRAEYSPIGAPRLFEGSREIGCQAWAEGHCVEFSINVLWGNVFDGIRVVLLYWMCWLAVGGYLFQTA